MKSNWVNEALNNATRRVQRELSTRACCFCGYNEPNESDHTANAGPALEDAPSAPAPGEATAENSAKCDGCGEQFSETVNFDGENEMHHNCNGPLWNAVTPQPGDVTSTFDAQEVVEEWDRRKCAVYFEPCPEHRFVHGAEAEELREGIEKLMVSENDVPCWKLQRLLEEVDARDSLAYREANPRNDCMVAHVDAKHCPQPARNCNGAECERVVRELRQRHQDDVVYAYGMGQENGLRAAIDIFSRNTVGPEDDSRTNQYAKSSIRGTAPPLSGESAAAGLLAECERVVRELRQELETARQHAENLESALKIEKEERNNLQTLRARDVHSAEDAYVRYLDEVIELKRVWSAKIGELEQQHTADQERIRELEKDLNQLAGVVGRALLVRTLAVGESFKEPSEHAGIARAADGGGGKP